MGEVVDVRDDEEQSTPCRCPIRALLSHGLSRFRLWGFKFQEVAVQGLRRSFPFLCVDISLSLTQDSHSYRGDGDEDDCKE